MPALILATNDSWLPNPTEETLGSVLWRISLLQCVGGSWLLCLVAADRIYEQACTYSLLAKELEMSRVAHLHDSV